VIASRRSQADAAAALQEAAEVKVELEQLRMLSHCHQGGTRKLQIRVAKEYVDKDMVREIETRVIAAVEKASKASTEPSPSSKRIDGIADGRRARQTYRTSPHQQSKRFVMRRSLIAVVAGFCLIAGTSADARPKHPSHNPAIHHDAPIKRILVTTCIPGDPGCRESQGTITVEVADEVATRNARPHLLRLIRSLMRGPVELIQYLPAPQRQPAA